jgi:hypothetical protein
MRSQTELNPEDKKFLLEKGADYLQQAIEEINT